MSQRPRTKYQVKTPSTVNWRTKQSKFWDLKHQFTGCATLASRRPRRIGTWSKKRCLIAIILMIHCSRTSLTSLMLMILLLLTGFRRIVHINTKTPLRSFKKVILMTRLASRTIRLLMGRNQSWSILWAWSIQRMKLRMLKHIFWNQFSRTISLTICTTKDKMRTIRVTLLGRVRKVSPSSAKVFSHCRPISCRLITH